MRPNQVFNLGVISINCTFIIVKKNSSKGQVKTG
jgi:hypothetical protein